MVTVICNSIYADPEISRLNTSYLVIKQFSLLNEHGSI